MYTNLKKESLIFHLCYLSSYNEWDLDGKHADVCFRCTSGFPSGAVITVLTERHDINTAVQSKPHTIRPHTLL